MPGRTLRDLRAGTLLEGKGEPRYVRQAKGIKVAKVLLPNSAHNTRHHVHRLHEFAELVYRCLSIGLDRRSKYIARIKIPQQTASARGINGG